MAISIKLTPESQAKVDGLIKAGKLDLRPTMEVIGIGYKKEVRQIFDKQQPRTVGERWKALSPDYKAWKDRHYPGAPLLVRTGRLKESMITEGAPGNINIIGKNGAVFGSSIRYGIYHDQPDGATNGKMPRRNFSEPSERRMSIWMQQIEKDIIHNFEVNGISVDGRIFA